MEIFVKFATVLAWILFVLSTLLIAGRVYSAATYTELERILDRMKGRVVHFPITKPAICWIICVSWLIATSM